jgi:hypothetical protein
MSASYASLTGRNAGFLSPAEQETLRASSVLVCGVGGMGGTAAQTLARVGVGRLAITDPDRFEPSNLNRQALAFLDTVGQPKTAVARSSLRRINPELRVDVIGDDWTERLDELLAIHAVVVNAMDDVGAGIMLYRKAREHGATVVDAYSSPCPSVFVTRPEDPRPEERLGFPTVGVPVAELRDDQLRAAFLSEVDHVRRVSSGIDRLDAAVVAEILAGARPRSSFCPVVAIAGNLMAFEAVGCLLDRPSGAGPEGYFLDPWTGCVERSPVPGPVVRASAGDA